MEGDGSLKEEIIRIGAEAVVSKLRWNGFLLVSKHRVPKPYRMKELDRWIRDRRTLHEAKIIAAVKKMGVRCPAVILIDRSESKLYLQYIQGVELKKYLNNLPPKEAERLGSQLGEMVGRMHLGGVAHGDLTTSNIIMDKSGRLYLVDFGLSSITSDVEELAVDIHLLDRSLESAHFSLRKDFIRGFLRSYSAVAGREFSQRILDKVKEIRMRGRYVEERRRRENRNSDDK